VNRQIVKLFGLVVVLFAVLIAFTSYWAVFDAEALKDKRANVRPLLEQQQIKRGRILAADGTVLARSVAPVAPSWRPGGRHELAFVDRGGRVVVVDTDTRRRHWRAQRLPEVVGLNWTNDGRRLLVLSAYGLRVYEGRGRLAVHREAPDAGRFTDAAFIPGTHRVVLLRNAGDVVLLDTRRTIFRGSGLASVIPSPTGGWLLVTWPRADQWVFVGSGGRLRAVADVTGQFHSRSGFPRVEGWCCR